MSSVCRICLAGNMRLNLMENKVLLNIYEKLINTKFNSEDARPRAVCCYCYQKLLKCHTFSQIALRSEKILSDLYDRGLQVTHASVTEVNPNVKQHLSMTTTQSIYIDDNTTNAGPQATIKDEPSIDVKEEVTTEPDELLDVGSFPDHITESELTFEEDYSDQENDAEELFSNTHIDQSQPHGSSFTINDELLLSTKYKEEVTTEVDKLVEIGSSHEQSIKSRLRIEENDSYRGKDVGKRPYKIHVEKTKADDSKKTFSCNNCTKIFDMKSKLLSHITSSHSQVNGKQYSSKKKHTETNTCDKHFDQKSKLFCHIKTHTGEKPFACNVCDKQFNYKRNLVAHMRYHTAEKAFACNVCDKQFNRKFNLVTHMRTHIGAPFACNVCDKQFNQKRALVNHMSLHTDEKLFACNVCDKQFKQNSALVNHMRIHTGEKPFACNVCEKQFNVKCNFVSHMRMHTGEKPFACNACDKRFYDKYRLVRHMRTHTAEKPFACNVCDKQFNYKWNLVPHMRTHMAEKPYACNVCDKQFNYKWNLVPHMRTHVAVKPYACNICDKKFIQQSRVVDHMRIHTGEKPFTCDVCGKQYTVKSTLASHMKSHMKSHMRSHNIKTLTIVKTNFKLTRYKPM